jgi:hypothetical protein
MKELTENSIGAALEVHKTIGSGPLESADEDLLDRNYKDVSASSAPLG